MDIRQRLQDWMLLLKQERKVQIIAVVVVLFVVWAMFGENKPKQRVVLPPLPPQSGAPSPQEGYQDLVTGLQKKIQEQEQKLSDADEANKQLKESLAQSEDKISEILKKVIERMA
ncbi:MAG: hypothetical protein GX589_00640, partial [Deltaproteobacteria bacterium]|nr:hypothetical protein [Deltaproteobacteria bacterium]